MDKLNVPKNILNLPTDLVRTKSWGGEATAPMPPLVYANVYTCVQVHKRTAELFSLVTTLVNGSTHVEISTFLPRFTRWTMG